jgi:cytochrome P450
MVDTNAPPVADGALVDVDGRCPHAYYAAARARGRVEFEERTGYWVAASHSSVSKVLADEDTFPRLRPEEIVSDPKYVRTVATPSFLTGQDRLDHHRWWLEIFNPRALRGYRDGVVTEVVQAMLDRFAGNGRADLVHDYAEPLADRVIAGVLGLPWRDQQWMAELRRNFNLVERYKASIYLKPEESRPFAEAALEGTHRIDELLRPYMLRRAEQPDDTVMSRAIHDEAMRGWDEERLYGLIRTFFTGGSGTTSIQLVNAIHLMLITPGLTDLVGRGDDKLTARFVEEALRLVPTNHFRIRLLATDVTFEGANLRAGQTIAALIASGNRDASRYPRPAEVDLDRPSPRQHLTFSVGIGACVGSGLARVVLQEGLGQLVARLPTLRLDPDAGQPELGGSMFRQYSPLHVLFDADRSGKDHGPWDA